MCLKLVKNIDTVADLPINHTFYRRLEEKNNNGSVESADKFLCVNFSLSGREKLHREDPPPTDEESGMKFCAFHREKVEHFFCIFHEVRRFELSSPSAESVSTFVTKAQSAESLTFLKSNRCKSKSDFSQQKGTKSFIYLCFYPNISFCFLFSLLCLFWRFINITILITVTFFIQMITANELFGQIGESKHWDQQIEFLSAITVNAETAHSLSTPRNMHIVQTLLSDARAKVVLAVTEMLTALFEGYGSQMQNTALTLLGCEAVQRQLGSSNKLIFAAVHMLMRTIVMFAPSKKLCVLLTELMNTKNTALRESLSFYLLAITDSQHFSANCAHKVNRFVDDPSKEVRDNVSRILRKLSENSNTQKQRIIQNRENKENKENKENS